MLNNLKKIKEEYALIAIFLLLFIMSYSTPRYGDEYVYSFIYKTSKKIANINDVLISSYNIYMFWSGRILPNIFQSLFLYFDKLIYSIFNSLIFILLLKKTRTLSIKYGCKSNGKTFDYIYIFFLNLIFIPVFNQNYISMVSSINYSWMLFILICYIDKIEEMLLNKKTTWEILILGFLVGISNESSVIFANLFLLYKVVIKKQMINKKIFLSLWIGSVIQFFSPGNFVRRNHIDTIKTTYPFFERIAGFFHMKQTFLFIQVFLFLFLFLFYLRKKIKKQVIVPIEIFVSSFGTLCALLLLMPRNEPRAYLTSFYFFIMIIYCITISFEKNKYFSLFKCYISIFFLLLSVQIFSYYFKIVRNVEKENKLLVKHYMDKKIKKAIFYDNNDRLGKIQDSYRVYNFLSLTPEFFTKYFSEYYGFSESYLIPRKSKLLIMTPKKDFKLDNIVIVLDEGKNLEIYRTQKENKIFLLIPEDVKKIEITNKEFEIKEVEIIEAYKGTVFYKKGNIKKIDI